MSGKEKEMRTIRQMVPGLLILCGLVSAVRAGEVVITVHPQGAAAGLVWPMTAGVPFKQGDLTDPAAVRLLDPNGREVPCQVRQTARWLDDGSVKWLLLDFDTTLGPQPAKYALEYGEGVKPASHPAPIAIEEQAGGLVIRNGPLALHFTRRGSSVPERVERDGREALRSGQDDGFYMVDEGGKRFSFGHDAEATTLLEERGPQRVVVKSEGWNVSVDGQKLGRNVVRMTIYAGKPFVRVSHTFIIAADSDKVRYRDIGLQLPVKAERYALPEVTGELAEPGYLLQWQHNRYEMTVGGQNREAGERASGSVSAWGGDSAVTLTMRDFWQNFPKEIEVTKDALRLHLWPAHNKSREHVGDKLTHSTVAFLPWAHEGEVLDFCMPQEVVDKFHYGGREDNVLIGRFSNAIGLGKTHELLLHFHAPAARDDAQAVARAFQARPLPVPDPVHMCATGAFGRLAPAGVGPYELVEEGLMAQLDWTIEMREKTGDYGMFNYGDYHFLWNAKEQYWGHHRHYAQWHHGGARVPWLLFARTGEPRCLKFAVDNTRHLTDVDMCHYEGPEVDEIVERHAEAIRQKGLAAFLSQPTEREAKAYPTEELIDIMSQSVTKHVGGNCKYIGFVHWYGGGRAYYNSMSDFMLYGYYFTGDRWFLDAALAHGDCLLGITKATFSGRAGTGRGDTALALYQATGEKRYLHFARLQMERSLQPTEGGRGIPNGHSIENFYYAPFGERWYEMTGDPRLAERWPLWAQVCLDRKGQVGDTRRDVHYEKLAYGYLVSGREEFLTFGLDMLKSYLDDRRRPDGWEANGGIQAVHSYTIQQWGLFLDALREHHRKTGQWLPLSRSGQTPSLVRFFRGVPIAMYARKAPGETIHFPLPGGLGKGTLTTVTGPDGKVLYHKPREQAPDDAQRPPIEKSWLKLGPDATAGDYRIDVDGEGEFVGLWTPVKGDVRKLVFSLPLELQRGGRMFFLPVAPKGRAPEFSFYLQGRDAAQFCRVDGLDAKQQAFASSEGGDFLLKHRPDPATLGEEPWQLTRGGQSGMFVVGRGDLLPLVSFSQDQFFVPEVLKHATEADAEILWHLDEGKGPNLSDAAWRGQTVPLGSLEEADENDPQWVDDGVKGSALRFGGRSYVRFPRLGRAAYRLTGLDEITAEAWVRLPAGAAKPATLLALARNLSLDVGPAGITMTASTRDGVATGAGQAALGDGQWHHVAVSYDGRELRAFVDGKSVARQQKCGGPLTYYGGGLFWLGVPEAGRPGFVGDVDEVMVSHWCRYTEDFTPSRP
jgi:hypothetical protein